MRLVALREAAMIFRPTAVDGAFVVEPERHDDERGFFARTWAADEFAAAGLVSELSQCSISWNARAATLRGMHWQAEPHPEHKLVRCTRGAVHDVAVDLRPGSPTYLCHAGVRLDEDNRWALYVPSGVAHGFVTLVDGSELLYCMDVPHTPEAARGARWDDPLLGIDWPVEPMVIAERDRTYPLLSREAGR